MDQENSFWSVKTFSLANPAGEVQGDVSRLLRSLADRLEAIQELQVINLILEVGVNDYGSLPTATVYFRSAD